MRVLRKEVEEEERRPEGQLHAEDGEKEVPQSLLSEMQEPPKFPAPMRWAGQPPQPGMGFLHRENITYRLLSQMSLIWAWVVQVFISFLSKVEDQATGSFHWDSFGTLFLVKIKMSLGSSRVLLGTRVWRGTFLLLACPPVQSLPLGSNTHLSYIRTSGSQIELLVY